MTVQLRASTFRGRSGNLAGIPPCKVGGEPRGSTPPSDLVAYQRDVWKRSIRLIGTLHQRADAGLCGSKTSSRRRWSM
jgi:hypothetical protein